MRGVSVTFTVKPAVKVDDAGAITNRVSFCSLGSDFVIYQDDILLTNSTVSLTSTTLTLTFVFSPISPILNPSILKIGYRDRRDASSKYVYTSI